MSDNTGKSHAGSGLYARIQSDPTMKSCFDALPEMVQESILMSGIDIKSIDQLRSVADKLLSRG